MIRKYLAGFVVLLACAQVLAGENLEALVKTCSSCHGDSGVSEVPMVPSIAGLPEMYLQSALTEFQDGQRPCPKMQLARGNENGSVTDMCSISAGLSFSQVDMLAEWYSQQAFKPARQSFNAELAAQGKEIHYAYCEGCHSQGGSQPDADAGVLAGQWMPYLQAVIQDFRSGGRPMIDDMADSFKRLQDEEFQALVHYYASQQ